MSSLPQAPAGSNQAPTSFSSKEKEEEDPLWPSTQGIVGLVWVKAMGNGSFNKENCDLLDNEILILREKNVVKILLDV